MKDKPNFHQKNLQTIEEGGKKYIWKQHAVKLSGKAEKTLERQDFKSIVSDNKVFYLIEDLEEYLSESKKVKHKTKVMTDTDGQTPTNALATTAPEDLQKLLQGIGGMFAHLSDKLDNRAESKLERVSGKIMLDADETAQFSGFSRTQIIGAIHAAERAGTLQRFTGERGKAVWRAADLDGIIESIPPVDLKKIQNRQPPPPASKDKTKKRG